LSEPEREAVLEMLHSERFVDVSPEETYATLLDEGTYLCSTRTMYRIIAARHGGVRERRDQLTHPAYAKPELLAERPNELPRVRSKWLTLGRESVRTGAGRSVSANAPERQGEGARFVAQSYGR
jgi:hypothetical protein